MDNLENLLGVGSRVKHSAYGDGVVIKLNYNTYDVCFMLYGIKEIGKTYDKWEIIERIEPEDTMTFSKIEKSLVSILKKWSDATEVVPLGDKWVGGTLVFKPLDSNLQGKEVPIDTFFNKIVMVRDRVRVMEQRINAHPNLDAEEKINLQQYITRIYGSLTTFNVLFKYKDQHFKGESKK
jgi:hypothetical protein